MNGKRVAISFNGLSSAARTAALALLMEYLRTAEQVAVGISFVCDDEDQRLVERLIQIVSQVGPIEVQLGERTLVVNPNTSAEELMAQLRRDPEGNGA